MNVNAISKVALSPDRENDPPISIILILSKVYEKLVSNKISSFCKKYAFLPAAQFAYRKGLGCWDGVLYRLLDFIAAFDIASHSGRLFKLKSWCRWHCAVRL